jgi:hypothetical protein
LPLFASALLLCACETTEERLIAGAAEEEANAERLADCQLTGATLSSSGNRYRLALPREIYAVRDQAPTAGRLACMSRWAQDHGVTLTIAEAR